MDVNDVNKLWDLLENSTNKIAILIDSKIFSPNMINSNGLLFIIEHFLSDEEKVLLLESEQYREFDMRAQIIAGIQDNKIKTKCFTNDKIMSLFNKEEIRSVFNSLDAEGRFQILQNVDFLKEHNFTDSDFYTFIKWLPDGFKRDLLQNRLLIEQVFQLDNHYIIELIKSIANEDDKIGLIDVYEYTGYCRASMLMSFSDEGKINDLIKNSKSFDKDELKLIIYSLSTDSLIILFKNNKQILSDHNIKPYEITMELSPTKQHELILRLDEMGLEIDEIRKILATLKSETKQNVDTSNFQPEYVSALGLNLCEGVSKIGAFRKILVDFNISMEEYKGFDELLYLNPMEVTPKNKVKLIELLKICPNVKLSDYIVNALSTVEEYITAEEWIESILQQIDESWTDIQKVAFIDNAIGKKISYSPDFDTEVFRSDNSRALWKIIKNGYGVCNGIAQVEKYILDRIGIDSKIVASRNHAFLIIQGIEMPDLNGETITGDTILDPTWNLAAHRYGAMPQCFCKSYEQMRKKDIGYEGIDSEAHKIYVECLSETLSLDNQDTDRIYAKIDEESLSATLNLDEQSLRNIYTSIGIADKDGIFPIKEMLDELKKICKKDSPTKDLFELVLFYFETKYPDFADCQNSTLAIFPNVVLSQEIFMYDRCVVNRVYDRNDEEKRPVLYVYMDYGEEGKIFYYADKERKGFIRMSQEEFEKRFECYEMDMKKQNGKRPWENLEEKENVESQTNGYENNTSQEGGER